MQKYIFIAICVVMFSSCGNNTKNEMPVNLLSQQQMEAVLYDMHLAEGLLSVEPSSADSTARRALGLYDLIYKKHQTNKQQFKESYMYYTNNPKLLDSVYTRIIERLSLQESILKK
ncbi:MAG: DUF4296 domain-containing protein [Bacteroidia bacterium]|nr:DUF4296 domain-containing protein [Bacteroidia bacterium]